jgi:hypothetical protein
MKKATLFAPGLGDAGNKEGGESLSNKFPSALVILHPPLVVHYSAITSEDFVIFEHYHN